MTTLAAAEVSRVVIERLEKRVFIYIHAARPGVLIGKKGSDIDKLKSSLCKMINSDVSINIVEVRKPEVDAKLVADNIARQLERRVSFRRAMKRSMQTAMKLGALGIRVNCSGRLGGAEIARVEWFREGRVPLHTLKSLVDFGVGVAKTTYGTCGVKVWVYSGDQKSVVGREKVGANV
jgi:small subunit ribosomal protein S3